MSASKTPLLHGALALACGFVAAAAAHVVASGFNVEPLLRGAALVVAAIVAAAAVAFWNDRRGAGADTQGAAQ